MAYDKGEDRGKEKKKLEWEIKRQLNMETQTRKILTHWSGNEEADHTLACITQLFTCDILIISAFIFLHYEEVNIGQLVVVFSICDSSWHSQAKDLSECSK